MAVNAIPPAYAKYMAIAEIMMTMAIKARLPAQAEEKTTRRFFSSLMGVSFQHSRTIDGCHRRRSHSV
jgi:hypothetical protein